MTTIKLQSSDGEVFDVDLEIAKCSGTIKTMLDDLGMEEEGEEIIPLSNVNSSTLRKVITWATYHKDDTPSAAKNHGDKSVISEWDSDFLGEDQGTICEIILAANFLDIKGLLHLGCQCVANMMKGKTPEEMRKFFNIKGGISPAVVKQLKKKDEMCKDD